jgi:hypothetical protein
MTSEKIGETECPASRKIGEFERAKCLKEIKRNRFF